MVAIIIICSFIGSGSYECDRGEVFTNIIDCYEYADKLSEVKNIVARCEVIEDNYDGN